MNVGARYPRLTENSVFLRRPWDDGKLTPEQLMILVKKRRKEMLEL